MNKLLVAFCLLFPNLIFSQVTSVEFNKQYSKVLVTKSQPQRFRMQFDKGQVYRINVQQLGIDVKLILRQGAVKVDELDSPNGNYGLEDLTYTASGSGEFLLEVERLDEAGNPDSGYVTVSVKKYTKKEIEQIEKNRKELEPENKKDVQTLDIDHFWQAYDQLKTCKNRADSINTIQTLYLDRGTDGLKDFISARQFTAEKFVNNLSRLPKFFASIRKNTFRVKEAASYLQQTLDRFKELYPNYKASKVCFAIGLVNTGGTVSSKFVLIGTEVTTCTREIDLSEFNNSSFSKVLAGDTNIVQKVKNMVAHESVHIQQRFGLDPNAVGCPLLYSCMQEGFCDFIGELTSGGQINESLVAYGNAHEKELWAKFKSQLCSNAIGDWLYNYSSVKDKPADLGYYMGYRITQAYYNKATDKKQAIIDIIEMKNPLQFLEKSGYDKTPKN